MTLTLETHRASLTHSLTHTHSFRLYLHMIVKVREMDGKSVQEEERNGLS
jgi:hypothetical protein